MFNLPFFFVLPSLTTLAESSTEIASSEIPSKNIYHKYIFFRFATVMRYLRQKNKGIAT